MRWQISIPSPMCAALGLCGSQGLREFIGNYLGAADRGIDRGPRYSHAPIRIQHGATRIVGGAGQCLAQPDGGTASREARGWIVVGPHSETVTSAQARARADAGGIFNPTVRLSMALEHLAEHPAMRRCYRAGERTMGCQRDRHAWQRGCTHGACCKYRKSMPVSAARKEPREHQCRFPDAELGDRPMVSLNGDNIGWADRDPYEACEGGLATRHTHLLRAQLSAVPSETAELTQA